MKKKKKKLKHNPANGKFPTITIASRIRCLVSRSYRLVRRLTLSLLLVKLSVK
jgi:hypothetical protein